VTAEHVEPPPVHVEPTPVRIEDVSISAEFPVEVIDLLERIEEAVASIRFHVVILFIASVLVFTLLTVVLVWVYLRGSVGP
jgi:hypothetical protein